MLSKLNENGLSTVVKAIVGKKKNSKQMGWI